MKKIFITVVLIITHFVFAQTITKIVYTQTVNGVKSKSNLLYNNTLSMYKIYKNTEANSIKKANDGTVIVPSNKIDSMANKQRFILFKNNNFFYNNINGDKEFVVKDKIEWRWKLFENIEKEILGLKCNKAEGFLGNKKYIIWYSKKYRENYGPAKINQAPGLILEASTDDGILSITAENITFINNDKEINNILSRYNLDDAITPKEYEIILEKHLQNLEKEIESTIGIQNFKFKKDCNDCNNK